MKIGRRSVALTPLAMGLVAACGSGGNTGAGTATTTGGGDKPVDGTGKKLTVWIMEGTNKDAKPFFDDVAKKFKEQTKADLDVQFVPWAGAHDKFVTSIAGNTTPDVAEVGTTWNGEFADAGALSDLTDQVKAQGGTEKLIPALVESATTEGKLYGMPWYAGIRSVLYRKDYFEKAGVKEPKTWSEFREVALKLKTANPGVTAFPVIGESEYCASTWVWGAGGEIAVQEGKKWKAAIDSEKAREGLRFYTDLALKDQVSTPAAATWKETELLDSFIKGQSAMVINGSWTPPKILAKDPTLKEKIGVFPIPGKNSGISPSFIGGSNLCVFEKSKNKDLAWVFVKLMAYGEFAEKWAKDSNYFPGTKEGVDKLAKGGDPLIAPFAKQFLEGGKTNPNTPTYGKIQGAKVWSQMLSSIISGKANVEQATSTAATEMNKHFSAG